MAFDVSAENLSRELRQSKDKRDRHLKSWHEMVEQYHGSEITRDGKTTGTVSAGSVEGIADQNDEAASNHYLEYVIANIARMVFDNPRVSGRSKRGGEADVMSVALGHACNRWARETNLVKTLQLVVLDMFFGFGVTAVRAGPEPGEAIWQNTRNHLPMARRVSPFMFAADVFGGGVVPPRFMGELIIADKDDLVRQAKAENERNRELGVLGIVGEWEIGELESLNSESGFSDVPEQYRRDTVKRNEVAFWQVWVPDLTDASWPGADQGFHGGIVTLINGEHGAKVLRGQRAYWGPPTGPYTVFGAYDVPDLFLPMSPLVAVKDEVDRVNQMLGRVIENMRNRKKVVVIDDDKITDAMLRAPNNTVLRAQPGPDSQVQEIEIGGVTDQDIRALELAQRALERSSGFGSAQRGDVDGEGTATEQVIAQQSNVLRTSWLERRVGDASVQVVRKAAWYIYHDDRVTLPLDAKAGEMTGIPDPVFQGGGSIEPGEFDRIELELEIRSMARTSEALEQRRVLELISGVSTLAELAKQPHVDVEPLVQLFASAMNEPGVGGVIDGELAKQLQGVEADGNAYPADDQPRMRGDLRESEAAQRALARLSGSAVGGGTVENMGNQAGNQAAADVVGAA